LSIPNCELMQVLRYESYELVGIATTVHARRRYLIMIFLLINISLVKRDAITFHN